MASFEKEVNISVDEYFEGMSDGESKEMASLLVDAGHVNISVSMFCGGMSSEEENEMVSLLIDNGDLDIIDIVDSCADAEAKEKFYKELAYRVGTTDTEFLDNLIEALQYWKK